MNPKIKDILLRTLSGIMLLIVVLGAVLFSEYTFLLLICVICVGVLWEFYGLATAAGKSEPLRIYSTVISVIIITVCFFIARDTFGIKWTAGLIPALTLIFAIELFRGRKTPLLNICVSLGGIIYSTLPFVLMCFIVFAGKIYNPFIILSCIFIVWMNDIFAYLAGVWLGRHKMYERISPKKTWEGFIGGMFFAIGFAVLCGHFMDENLMKWAVMGTVIAVSGVMGDFIESMLKREAGVKDSGNIMPGHGGFMDRFDALVYSMPFVFSYLYIVK